MNKISAVIIGFLLLVVVLLEAQIAYLNNVITFSGNEYVAEISKNVDCQNTLEGTQIDLQRALKAE